jgi:predicted transcriptional regulator
LKGVEVRFTPEQEARLSQIATRAGPVAERLVKDAALRLLQEKARYRSAVRKGVAQADRSEFIEEEEMEARLEQMLHSRKSVSAGRQRPQRICRAFAITSRTTILATATQPCESCTGLSAI